MSALACIIPVVGTMDELEITLLSVLERRTDACEVLVVLNVPYDDPYHLQGEIRIIQAPVGTGLVDCINLGIAATQAPIVHLLAPGSEVDHAWAEKALNHFADPCVAAVAPTIYDRLNHESTLVAGVSCQSNGRKIIQRIAPSTDKPGTDDTSIPPLGPSLQAAFYRKSALAALGGGVPTAVGSELADIDLALSLHHAGWRLVAEPACRIFAPALTQPHQYGFSSGLQAERFYWRHFAELGGFKELLSHPLVAAKDILSTQPWWKMPAQAMGRLIAACQFGHYRKYQQLMMAARNDAAVAKTQQQTNRTELKPLPSLPGTKQRRTDPQHESNHAHHLTQKRLYPRRQSRR